MLPLILGALAIRLVQHLQAQGAGSPSDPALAVPQVHRPGGPVNAVAAPSLAIPFAAPVTRIPGPIPSSAGLPISGPPIPPLSHLIDMPFVAGIPEPDAVRSVQINPNMHTINYGPVIGGGRSSAGPGR
jgi:hypothetical protein